MPVKFMVAEKIPEQLVVELKMGFAEIFSEFEQKHKYQDWYEDRENEVFIRIEIPDWNKGG